jgi:hypothetical protein
MAERFANSSAPERGFAAFLARAFSTLEREMPTAYRAMCARLARHPVLLHVDTESVALVFTATHARFVASVPAPRVLVRTSRATILAVLDAEATLMDAVLDERLRLWGGTDDLLTFHDALMLFVHGAVRAPSFSALLRAYRGDGGVDGRAAAPAR